MSISMGRVVAGAAYVLIRAKDETGKVLAEVNKKVAKVSRNFGNIGGSMESAGMRLGLAMTGIGQSMYVGVREAQKYQDALLATQAVLQVTSEQMKPLEKKIRELGRTTSYTAEEVALGAEELARGGLTLEQVYNSLDDVINLARAGQVTMADAAMYMVRSLMAFEIPATQASRVADALFVASSAGTTTVQELGSALSFVAGTAHDMGMSFEEAVATLAIFSNNMLTGTKGGTSLNNLLVEMTKNADKVRELFGFEMFKGGEARPMLEVFTDLRKGMADMTQKERTTVLQDLFNIRGTRAAQALKQMERVEEVMEKLRKGEITAADAAKLMDSGIGGSIRRITSALNALAVTFGLAFEGMFQSLEDRFIPILNGLEEWFKQNADLAKKLAVAVLGMMAAAGGLIAMGMALKLFGFALIAISGIATVLGVLIPLIAKTIIVVYGLAQGLQLLTLIPGDIGNAFIGLQDAIYNTFGNIMEIFGTAFNAIKERVMAGDIVGAMNILMVTLNQAWNLGILGFKKAWLEFSYYITKVWYDVVLGVKKVWLDMTTSLAKTILDMAAGNKFFGAVFKQISGVDVAAERERAARLGNTANTDTAQLDRMNEQNTNAMLEEYNSSNAQLEEETRKLREQYEEQTKDAKAAVDQSIAMAKLEKPKAGEVPNEKPYSYEETVGGDNRIKSVIAKSMPEGLEMGSTEAAKAGFENRKASLDAAQKTASNTQKIAEGINVIVKRGDNFVITGVGSSTTTPAGG